MEELLAETYGLIVYQEQLLQIPHVLAGFSLEEGELVRSQLTKGEEEKPRGFKDAFEKGCAKKGILKSTANRIWDSMAESAPKVFNKAHSVAYTVITCQEAYLKSHFPVQYQKVVKKWKNQLAYAVDTIR